MALLTGALVTFVSGAWAQSGPKMDSIVQPIVPDAEIGLPDKAPSTFGAAPATPKPPAKAAARDAGAGNAAGWSTDCPDEAAKTRCQAIVRATVGNQTALVMAVARTGSAATPRFQMAVPLGLSIQKGVTVSLGGYSGDFPISRCTAQGCLVEADAPPAMIEALQKVASGRVVIHSEDNKPIQLPLPAKGFRDSFAALTAVE